MRSQSLVVVWSMLVVGAVAHAQTDYYNLDAGRPVRVEDATPTGRNDLDVQLAPFRAERYVGGLMRYRAEPKVSYGIFPLTEIEIRMPVMEVVPRDSGSRPVSGIASLAIGATHALTMEGATLPAIAIAAEWVAPVGRFSAPRSSVGIRALMTKTFVAGRIHLNVGVGSYSVQPAPAIPTVATPGCIPPGRFVYVPLPPGGVYCPDTAVVAIPFIPDFPCEVRPTDARAPAFPAAAPHLCGGGSSGSGTATTATATSAVASSSSGGVAGSVSHGTHTFIGVAFDHTFPLSSTLVAASISSERFEGLYPTPDLTVEVGVRHQLSPRLAADAGFSRRLCGSVQFTALTAGGTFVFARPFHFRDRR